jgi:prepilin-type processing-associated H-X9-DG protein
MHLDSPVNFARTDTKAVMGRPEAAPVHHRSNTTLREDLMRRQTAHKAFSLVELLAVVSTTAVLLGVLLPSLHTARRQAQRTLCLSNLRQMTLAAHSYGNTNDGHYPLAYYTTRKDNARYYFAWDYTTWKDWSDSSGAVHVEPGLLWMDQVVAEIQQCPSFKGAHSWFEDPYTGYNYNTSYIGLNETVSPVDSARTTEVQDPGGTALFGDGEYTEGANKFMRAPFASPRDASLDEAFRHAGAQGYRHLRQTNVAFCDGHAASWRDIHTQTAPAAKAMLDAHNRSHAVRIGFLSPDNRVYDLE